MKNEIVKINNVEVCCSRAGEDVFVPVKPICEALQIQFQAQYNALKEHPIYRSVISLRDTTGADGKTYEMVCMPIKFVFGWVLGINPNNVKEVAQEALIKYQLEAHDTLYERFYLMPILQERKLKTIREQELKIANLKYQRKEINEKIKMEEMELETIWITEPKQLVMALSD
jgi:hypothetical protein